MDITILGGAEEIGASCAVVDVAGDLRLLIDCGQRLGAPPGQELPDFSPLEVGPKIHSILLTHAHLDHVGGLPALEPWLAEDCMIYGTAATLDLARVMLEDSLRSGSIFRQGMGQIPLFAPSSVNAVRKRFRPIRWGQPLKFPHDVRVTFLPAGHILGASMLEIRSNEGTALFSGDVSIADQASVPGAFVPSCEPHVLVLESTYGNRLHTHRPLQEQKLISRVSEVIADGGNVLFPTFALGRAQEVMLILGRAMRDGHLPHTPIFADGLVREVCRVYSRHVDDLSSFCRRLADQGYDPLFPDDLPIRHVRDQQDRLQVMDKRPVIVVASGGMLQGGASQAYARAWLSDERSLIAITGYQDEESPGQALMKLAALPATEPRFFAMSGVQVEVCCKVEQYSLSAHADNQELVGLVSKLKPKLVLPVHGDASARDALAFSLRKTCRSEVVLPMQGDVFRVKGGATEQTTASPTARLNPLALWPPWDPYTKRDLDLPRFHEWLASVKPPLKWITVEELAGIWRAPNVPTDEEVDVLRTALAAQEHPYFVEDSRRPYLLHITARENLNLILPKFGADQVWDLVHQIFPKETGLERVGLFPGERVVELAFRFPGAIEAHLRERLNELSRRSGWSHRLVGDTHTQQLQTLLSQWLDKYGTTDFRVDHSANSIWIPLAAEGVEDAQALSDRFSRRTGYRLIFQVEKLGPSEGVAGDFPN